MNTISKYATYLSSAIFGSTLVFIFMADMSRWMKWAIALSVFIVWFFPLVRIGYLLRKNSEKPINDIEKLKRNTLDAPFSCFMYLLMMILGFAIVDGVNGSVLSFINLNLYTKLGFILFIQFVCWVGLIDNMKCMKEIKRMRSIIKQQEEN